MHLHSNMERFKERNWGSTKHFKRHLHSNMERFKALGCAFPTLTQFHLHSNMERFKVNIGYDLSRVKTSFTFQYGEI